KPGQHHAHDQTVAPQLVLPVEVNLQPEDGLIEGGQFLLHVFVTHPLRIGIPVLIAQCAARKPDLQFAVLLFLATEQEVQPSEQRSDAECYPAPDRDPQQDSASTGDADESARDAPGAGGNAGGAECRSSLDQRNRSSTNSHSGEEEKSCLRVLPASSAI